jgi:integrase/recombinase XerC
MSTTRATKLRMSRSALGRSLEGFLRSLRRKRPETRGTYQRALREFVRWFVSDGHVRFEVRDIERYKRYLTVRRRFAPVSVSTYLTAVRRYCEYLVHRGVLAENPAKEVGGNERPRSHSRDFLLPGEVDRLLAAINRSDERGLRDYAIVKLMVRCALSEIEIVRADRGDLACEPGEARLAVQGKGRVTKDALVAVPPDVQEALEGYMALRGPLSPDQPLFASAGNRTRGARMTTRGVRDRVNTWLELAGVRQEGTRRVSPYSLRHTAARLMAQDGASPDEIRQRLRLGSLTTAMLYIEKPLPEN